MQTYTSAHKGAVADPELWAPKTRETADHSMPVSIAMTLIDGTVTPESFSRGRFKDSDVLGLIGRMDVEILETFSKETPAVRNCRLEAVGNDGTTHEAHHKLTAADIETGPTDEELVGKFRMLTDPLYSRAAQDRLIETCWDLENCDRIADLVSLTEL